MKPRDSGGAFRDLLDFCQRVSAEGMNKRTQEALIHAGALDALAKNRASLMLQLPEAMRATEQMTKNRDAGMFDMFGCGNGDIRIELPDTDEWPLAQLLQGEHDTLGHYLSGHPVDPYREDVQKLVGHDLSALASIWESELSRIAQEGRELAPAGASHWSQGKCWACANAAIRRRSCNWMTAAAQIECGFFGDTWQEFAPTGHDVCL